MQVFVASSYYCLIDTVDFQWDVSVCVREFVVIINEIPIEFCWFWLLQNSYLHSQSSISCCCYSVLLHTFRYFRFLFFFTNAACSRQIMITTNWLVFFLCISYILSPLSKSGVHGLNSTEKKIAFFCSVDSATKFIFISWLTW